MIVKIFLVHKIDIKNVGQKIVCFKKFWVQKVLIVQKMFGPKILGFKIYWIQKIGWWFHIVSLVINFGPKPQL